MTSSPSDNPVPGGRFHRAGRRHRFTARQAAVRAVSVLPAGFVRVTLTGPELRDFESTGPADHVRVFFPDPETGVLHAPAPLGPDQEGLAPAAGQTLARDFTPLNPRTNPTTDEREFDLDILQHPNPGPAAQWAGRAIPGDRLVIVGPKGSRETPHEARRLILVVDGTALPSAYRWLQAVPADTFVHVLLDNSVDIAQASDYLARASQRVVGLTRAGDDIGAEMRGVQIDETTYVFAAGEAGRLGGVRRYLREFRLPPEQYTISGYWKRGAAAFDHHQPIPS